MTDKVNAIEKAIQELNIPEVPGGLYDPVKYTLMRGGKRIRPLLVIMGHELFGGKYHDVISQSVAIELFHNFSLIHDDIMDEAPLRRGKETVHKKWNRNAAILSGDAMLVMAYQQVIQCAPDLIPEIMGKFSKTALEVCEGQQLDMDFENRSDVTIEEYIEMIGLKTAVLLGCSLWIGARLAGASNKDADHLYSFGKNLGISFQLQDDLLDAFGNENKFGKKSGGDISANKKTFLYLSALDLCNEKQKEMLTGLYSDKPVNNEDKIESVLRLFRELNIEELTRDKMGSYFNKALSELEQINVSPEHKIPLMETANSLLVREY